MGADIPKILSRGLRLAFVAWLTGLAASALAAPQTPPDNETIELASYIIDLPRDPNWISSCDREKDCAVVALKTRGAGPDTSIGVFRLVVPEAVRAKDKLEIATAYAVHDVTGARFALYQNKARLLVRAKTPRPMKGGVMFKFDEPHSSFPNRIHFTDLTQAFVYFPANYSQDGELYLIITNTIRMADALESALGRRVDDIVLGIRKK